jgi:hypothetical protein
MNKTLRSGGKMPKGWRTCPHFGAKDFEWNPHYKYPLVKLSPTERKIWEAIVGYTLDPHLALRIVNRLRSTLIQRLASTVPPSAAGPSST